MKMTCFCEERINLIFVQPHQSPNLDVAELPSSPLAQIVSAPPYLFIKRNVLIKFLDEQLYISRLNEIQNGFARI